MTPKLFHLCYEAHRDEKSLDEVYLWFEENKDKEDILTEAVNYQDGYNRTTLHWLVGTSPTSDFLERLLQLAPHTVRV